MGDNSLQIKMNRLTANVRPVNQSPPKRGAFVTKDTIFVSTLESLKVKTSKFGISGAFPSQNYLKNSANSSDISMSKSSSVPAFKGICFPKSLQNLSPPSTHSTTYRSKFGVLKPLFTGTTKHTARRNLKSPSLEQQRFGGINQSANKPVGRKEPTYTKPCQSHGNAVEHSLNHQSSSMSCQSRLRSCPQPNRFKEYRVPGSVTATSPKLYQSHGLPKKQSNSTKKFTKKANLGCLDIQHTQGLSEIEQCNSKKEKSKAKRNHLEAPKQSKLVIHESQTRKHTKQLVTWDERAPDEGRKRGEEKDRLLHEKHVVQNWHDVSEQIERSLAQMEDRMNVPLVTTKGVIFVEHMKGDHKSTERSVEKTHLRLMSNSDNPNLPHSLSLGQSVEHHSGSAKVSELKETPSSSPVHHKEEKKMQALIVFENETFYVSDSTKSKFFERNPTPILGKSSQCGSEPHEKFKRPDHHCFSSPNLEDIIEALKEHVTGKGDKHGSHQHNKQSRHHKKRPETSKEEEKTNAEGNDHEKLTKDDDEICIMLVGEINTPEIVNSQEPCSVLLTEENCFDKDECACKETHNVQHDNSDELSISITTEELAVTARSCFSATRTTSITDNYYSFSKATTPLGLTKVNSDDTLAEPCEKLSVREPSVTTDTSTLKANTEINGAESSTSVTRQCIPSDDNKSLQEALKDEVLSDTIVPSDKASKDEASNTETATKENIDQENRTIIDNVDMLKSNGIRTELASNETFTEIKSPPSLDNTVETIDCNLCSEQKRSNDISVDVTKPPECESDPTDLTPDAICVQIYNQAFANPTPYVEEEGRKEQTASPKVQQNDCISGIPSAGAQSTCHQSIEKDYISEKDLVLSIPNPKTGVVGVLLAKPLEIKKHHNFDEPQEDLANLHENPEHSSFQVYNRSTLFNPRGHSIKSQETNQITTPIVNEPHQNTDGGLPVSYNRSPGGTQTNTSDSLKLNQIKTVNTITDISEPVRTRLSVKTPPSEQLKGRHIHDIADVHESSQELPSDGLDSPISNWTEFEKSVKLVNTKFQMSRLARDTREVRTLNDDTVETRGVSVRQYAQKFTAIFEKDTVRESRRHLHRQHKSTHRATTPINITQNESPYNLPESTDDVHSEDISPVTLKHACPSISDVKMDSLDYEKYATEKDIEASTVVDESLSVLQNANDSFLRIKPEANEGLCYDKEKQITQEIKLGNKEELGTTPKYYQVSLIKQTNAVESVELSDSCNTILGHHLQHTAVSRKNSFEVPRSKEEDSITKMINDLDETPTPSDSEPNTTMSNKEDHASCKGEDSVSHLGSDSVSHLGSDTTSISPVTVIAERLCTKETSPVTMSPCKTDSAANQMPQSQLPFKLVSAPIHSSSPFSPILFDRERPKSSLIDEHSFLLMSSSSNLSNITTPQLSSSLLSLPATSPPPPDVETPATSPPRRCPQRFRVRVDDQKLETARRMTQMIATAILDNDTLDSTQITRNFGRKLGIATKSNGSPPKIRKQLEEDVEESREHRHLNVPKIADLTDFISRESIDSASNPRIYIKRVDEADGDVRTSVQKEKSAPPCLERFAGFTIKEKKDFWSKLCSPNIKHPSPTFKSGPPNISSVSKNQVVHTHSLATSPKSCQMPFQRSVPQNRSDTSRSTSTSSVSTVRAPVTPFVPKNVCVPNSIGMPPAYSAPTMLTTQDSYQSSRSNDSTPFFTPKSSSTAVGSSRQTSPSRAVPKPNSHYRGHFNYTPPEGNPNPFRCTPTHHNVPFSVPSSNYSSRQISVQSSSPTLHHDTSSAIGSSFLFHQSQPQTTTHLVTSCNTPIPSNCTPFYTHRVNYIGATAPFPFSAPTASNNTAHYTSPPLYSKPTSPTDVCPSTQGTGVSIHVSSPPLLINNCLNVSKPQVTASTFSPPTSTPMNFVPLTSTSIFINSGLQNSQTAKAAGQQHSVRTDNANQLCQPTMVTPMVTLPRHASGGLIAPNAGLDGNQTKIISPGPKMYQNLNLLGHDQGHSGVPSSNAQSFYHQN